MSDRSRGIAGGQEPAIGTDSQRGHRGSRRSDDAERRRVLLQDSEKGTAGLRKFLQLHAGHRKQE